MAILLLGMEARLGKKIEATNRAVNEAVTLSKQTNEALDALEDKVDSNEEAMRTALAETEEKLFERFEDQVKMMVSEQLRAVGFDTQLSAGDLTSLQTTCPGAGCGPSGRLVRSYAAVAAEPEAPSRPLTKSERQEAKFWTARRSLRLWLVPGGTMASLEKYMTDFLNLPQDFVEHDLGRVEIRKQFDKRSKQQHEVVVTFESKEIRDAVKANAPNLANHQDEAVM